MTDSKSSKAPRVKWVLAAFLLLSLTAGCDNDDHSTTEGRTDVCGLFDKATITGFLGHDEYRTEGTGMRDAAYRADNAVTCTVWDKKASAPRMIAVVQDQLTADGQTRLEQSLTAEAQSKQCSSSAEVDAFGQGYFCSDELESRLAVIQDGRLVRLSLQGTSTETRPSAEQAISLAKVALDNVAAAD